MKNRAPYLRKARGWGLPKERDAKTARETDYCKKKGIKPFRAERRSDLAEEKNTKKAS